MQMFGGEYTLYVLKHTFQNCPTMFSLKRNFTIPCRPKTASQKKKTSKMSSIKVAVPQSVAFLIRFLSL